MPGVRGQESGVRGQESATLRGTCFSFLTPDAYLLTPGKGEVALADALRILVVDDSALYRQLVKNVLRDCPGVEVVGVAKGGEEALKLVGTLTPDLLTLDVRMPDMDGIEVLRELRKRRSPAKALMLSSLTANGAKVTTDALLEGAFDFILKPS